MDTLQTPPPKAGLKPLQLQPSVSLANNLTIDILSHNVSGNNPADVTLSLQGVRMRAEGTSDKDFAVTVTPANGVSRPPTVEELGTLRKALADEIQYMQGLSTAVIQVSRTGVDLTLSLVEGMYQQRKAASAPVAPAKDHASLPAQPKQPLTPLVRLVDHH